MTFFVDANILIYSYVDSKYRAPCLDLMSAVATGHADARTSSAVLEEVWHIAKSGRAGELGELVSHAYTLFTPLLSVTDDAFRHALGLKARGIGTNDLVHAGTCIAHGIDTIVSADSDFDRIKGLHRIDPLDTRALHRLIG